MLEKKDTQPAPRIAAPEPNHEVRSCACGTENEISATHTKQNVEKTTRDEDVQTSPIDNKIKNKVKKKTKHDIVDQDIGTTRLDAASKEQTAHRLNGAIGQHLNSAIKHEPRNQRATLDYTTGHAAEGEKPDYCKIDAKTQFDPRKQLTSNFKAGI